MDDESGLSVEEEVPMIGSGEYRHLGDEVNGEKQSMIIFATTPRHRLGRTSPK